MNLRKNTLWFIPLFFFSKLSTQNLLHCKIVNSDNGLSNNSVIKVLKDYFNYIWILNSDGLNRYDGQEIRCYNEQLANTDCDQTTSCLLNNSNPAILGSTENGILCNLNNAKLLRLSEKFGEPKQSNNITAIVNIERNIYVAGTPIGLDIFRLSNIIIEKINQTRTEHVNDLFYNIKNRLWVATNEGILRYSKSGLLNTIAINNGNSLLGVKSLVLISGSTTLCHKFNP
jgi:ligand-binding sensor domain-containing protein